MKTATLFALVFGLSALLHAQPLPPDTLWARTYPQFDRTVMVQIKQDYDSGFVVLAERTVIQDSLVNQWQNILLFKLNGSGDLQWSMQYEGSMGVHYQPMDLCLTPDSSYLIAGNHRYEGNQSNFMLLKVSHDGVVLWMREYDILAFDYLESVKQTLDDGFILGGMASLGLQAPCPNRVCLLKVNANGDSLWTSIIDSDPQCDQDIDEVICTADGGYAFTGRSYPSELHTGSDVLIGKAGPTGELLWSDIFGSGMWEYPFGIIETPELGYAVGLMEAFYVDVRPWLLVYDIDGVRLLEQSYDTLGGYLPSVNDFIGTADGGVVFAGISAPPSGPNFDWWLSRINITTGRPEWQLITGRSEQRNYLVQVCTTYDGGFALAGAFSIINDPYGVVCVARLGFEEQPSAADEEAPLPGAPTLEQNYPNPFNPATTVAFTLPRAMEIEVAVYNLLGEKVAVLAAGQMNGGRHEVSFDAGALPSGLYFYRLEGENISLVRKMMLMK